MSATLERPVVAVRHSTPEPVVHPRVARTVGFLALGALVATQWGRLVVPNAGGRMLLALVVCALVAWGVVAAGQIGHRALRLLAIAAGTVAAVLLSLAIAGVPRDLLDPRNWDALASGLSQGIGTLPDTNVPYRGIDEWTRIAILLGGQLGLLIAALALIAARAKAIGIVALCVLYAVPITVLRAGEHPFLAGAVFLVLLAAALFLDRVSARRAPTAAALVGAAAVAGLALAPILDRDDPWLNYESLASQLARAPATFSWDHSYGPLDWPREGKVMLRVKAKRAAYWKAENLDLFDGERWLRSRRPDSFPRSSAELPDRYLELHGGWQQNIEITFTGLRSRDVIGAGTTIDLLEERFDSFPTGSPGTFRAARQIRPGDAYGARVYTPDPTQGQLRTAGTEYDDYFRRYLLLGMDLDIPQLPGSPPSVGFGGVLAPFFGETDVVPGYLDPTTRTVREISTSQLDDTSYRRSWRLARRLKAESDTPYEYVQQILSYLADDYTYTEAPPVRSVPLEGFLFQDRVGYCQQFSGAMAMLLRMGGVPARISTGFTTGRRDKKRKEYVVRDEDAHSWVEAYFPGLGWVPFDPTPASAPPAAQASLETGASSPDVRDLGREVAQGKKVPGANADEGGGLSGWLKFAAFLALAAGMVGLALWFVGRSARTPDGADGDLVELERALARSGRAPAPDTTLRQLERAFQDSPGATGYLRAVGARRYAGAQTGPSAEHRKALREELAYGLGPLGKLRAWWALPPQAARRRARSR